MSKRNLVGGEDFSIYSNVSVKRGYFELKIFSTQNLFTIFILTQYLTITTHVVIIGVLCGEHIFTLCSSTFSRIKIEPVIIAWT